ncbi:hypothetical protein AYL99_11681 [Fonsecaea erecta]|uniref:HNH nuclease domain-containing protein n=1 Tax=Fonsecaea erecta TaxID=1367422 RepID=A0A178Z3T6_9EURO|nr:hypothetical protein AYL99_11681 [Fonsecaea erecta]OAP54146.1 hypothetical protein AYL99_11681 [Fonsecaea erecta]
MSQSNTLPIHTAPSQTAFRTPSPPGRPGSPNTNASPGQGVINRRSPYQLDPAQAESDRGYDGIITALEQVTSSTTLTVKFEGAFHKDKLGAPVIKGQTMSFSKANAEIVMKSVLETRRLIARIIKIANKFDPSGPELEKVRSIDEYLRCTINLHHMLSEEALKMTRCLQEVKDHRQKMDNKQLADVREHVRSSMRLGMTPMASSSFLPMVNTSGGYFRLLDGHFKHHVRLMQHAQIWRNEVVNAAKDGTPMNTMLNLFTLKTAANCLGLTGIGNTFEKRKQLRKQAIKYYDIRTRLGGDDNEHAPDQRSSVEGLTITDPDNLASQGEGPPDEAFWCPILKRYFEPCWIRTAHIIPAKTPEMILIRTFGEVNAAGLLNSNRNLLCIHKRLEIAFDKGQITIVPVAPRSSHSEGPTEFRVFFIDRSLVYSHSIALTIVATRENIYWSDIAKDPVLQFKNDNRPGQRNLFWHFITSLTKAKKGSFVGLADALEEIDRKEVWHLPQPAPWIEKGILKSMAEQYLMPQIFIESATFKTNAKKLHKMEDDLAGLAVFKLSSPKIRSIFGDEYDADDVAEGMPPNFGVDEYYSPQNLLPLAENPLPTHWERDGSPTPGARLADTIKRRASDALSTTARMASKSYGRVVSLSLRPRKKRG